MPHPNHGSRPLQRKLSISAAIPKTDGRPELQLYKLQATVRPVQGLVAAEARARELERITGTPWTVSRI